MPPPFTHDVTLDGRIDDLGQDVLVGETHHKAVLGGVVLVLVLRCKVQRERAHRTVRTVDHKPTLAPAGRGFKISSLGFLFAKPAFSSARHR